MENKLINRVGISHFLPHFLNRHPSKDSNFQLGTPFHSAYFYMYFNLIGRFCRIMLCQMSHRTSNYFITLFQRFLIISLRTFACYRIERVLGNDQRSQPNRDFDISTSFRHFPRVSSPEASKCFAIPYFTGTLFEVTDLRLKKKHACCSLLTVDFNV